MTGCRKYLRIFTGVYGWVAAAGALSGGFEIQVLGVSWVKV